MKAAVIGLGLIGGSLGLELRELGWQVVGISRKEETCKIALERGIVHEASRDLATVSEAEIVFICTPMAAIASTLRQLIPYLSPHTIVTDVGSVKTAILQECCPLWHNFLGGHPMAGNSQQGVEAAVKGLFTGAPYVLTPHEGTDPKIVERVRDIATSLGCHTYICSAEMHDRAVAWISHLPVMVSAALIQACTKESAEVLQLAQQLASSGFRDTSRVGGGNWELGLMMAQYNRESVERSLLEYRAQLDVIIGCVQNQDWQTLQDTLQSTQQKRPHFTSCS